MPVVEYMVNYEYISTVLCENIDNPEMHCNGKCHLAKELDKSLSHKSPFQSEKPTILYEFIASQNYEAYFKRFYVINRKKNIVPFYFNLYKFLFSASVFEPPIL